MYTNIKSNYNTPALTITNPYPVSVSIHTMKIDSSIFNKL